MGGWLQTGSRPLAESDGYRGAPTDAVSRLWAGLEHQQELLGPIAGELMALLHPGVADSVSSPSPSSSPASPETDITSRG